jgi:guanylate kinase
MSVIKRRGLMLILSSPSGTGKTTLARMLLEDDEHVHTSISATTRKQRPGEVDGKHYYFIDEDKFKDMIAKNEFLEYAIVFGKMYGTPREYVENMLDKGEDVLFDIDWQGNRQLTAMARDDVVSVFILPPSMEELYGRLVKRNQDTPDVIDYRMERAGDEISHWHEYDYIIINKDLEESLDKLGSILRAERLKKARRTGLPGFVEELQAEKFDK